MNEREYKQLRETSWRRPLTPAEEAQLRQFLANDVAAQEDFLTEAALNQLLGRLPDTAPVPSNFTARVLETVRRDEANQERKSVRPAWNLGGLLRKLAFASLVVGIASMGYREHEKNGRAVLAKNVAEFTQAVTSNPQLLEDFDAIRQLDQTQSKADTEILALMK